MIIRPGAEAWSLVPEVALLALSHCKQLNAYRIPCAWFCYFRITRQLIVVLCKCWYNISALSLMLPTCDYLWLSLIIWELCSMHLWFRPNNFNINSISHAFKIYKFSSTYPLFMAYLHCQCWIFIETSTSLACCSGPIKFSFWLSLLPLQPYSCILY